MQFLLLISGADIQTPTSQGLVGDKFEHWRQELLVRGHSVVVAYLPLARRRLSRRTAFQVLGTRWLLVRSLVALLTVGLFRRRKISSLFNLDPLKILRKLYSEAHIFSLMRLATKYSADVICGIGLTSLEIETAQRLKIPSVEFQHGQYGHSSDYALYWPSSKPDYFCVWDSRTAQLARGYGLNPVVVGFPSVVEGDSVQTSEERVLVTLSWGFAGTVDPFGMIPQQLWSVLSSLSALGVPLTVRLHPVHSAWTSLRKAKVRRWFASNLPDALLSWPTSTSLESDLRGAYLHLTWESSVWFEAAIRGIPTVIINDKAYGGAEELRNSTLSSISAFCHYMDPSMPISALADRRNWTRSLRPSIGQFRPEVLLDLLK